jgi:hypothetical protein
VYAFYEYYAAVGFEGIKADLEALNFEGLKARAKEILAAFAAFLIGDVIASKVKDKYAKTAIRSIAYYVGAKQLASALDKGSTISRMTEDAPLLKATVSAGAMRGY